MKELEIKYGCNPHQKPAKISIASGELPLIVQNGTPSCINFMDALNAWQLVKELKSATGLPSAASFKHVSPAGAAIALPISDNLKLVYNIKGKELSEVATAYVRARGADRVSSFGDFVAVSDKVDSSLAELLSNEVSDGIIAPAFEEKALEILKKKKKGSYVILQIDAQYSPPEMEKRDIFGVTIEQRRNDIVIGSSLFEKIVTKSNILPAAALTDLIVATITLKYTQSNSICFATDGQVIGVGAGQQSRIHCTRLAAGKADIWILRQHPKVLGIKFKQGLPIAVRDNAVDMFLRNDVTAVEEASWRLLFDEVPARLSEAEKSEFIRSYGGIALSSDAFIPFRDNIDRAAASGVKYLAQAGGSVKDAEVVSAANEYGMVMCLTGLRLFHH